MDRCCRWVCRVGLLLSFRGPAGQQHRRRCCRSGRHQARRCCPARPSRRVARRQRRRRPGYRLARRPRTTSAPAQVRTYALLPDDPIARKSSVTRQLSATRTPNLRRTATFRDGHGDAPRSPSPTAGPRQSSATPTAMLRDHRQFRWPGDGGPSPACSTRPLLLGVREYPTML
jgi:hypothetical protein